MLEKFKDTKVDNLENNGSKSVLKMFSNEPSTVESIQTGEIMKSYQFYPKTTPGTALNIFYETADKVALNQLKAATSVLTVGKVLVDSKDQNDKKS